MQNVCSSKTVTVSRISLERNVLQNVPVRGWCREHGKNFYSVITKHRQSDGEEETPTPTSQYIWHECSPLPDRWSSRKENTEPLKDLAEDAHSSPCWKVPQNSCPQTGEWREMVTIAQWYKGTDLWHGWISKSWVQTLCEIREGLLLVCC